MMMVIITKSTSLNTRRIFTIAFRLWTESYRDRGRERVKEIEGESVIYAGVGEREIERDDRGEEIKRPMSCSCVLGDVHIYTYYLGLRGDKFK
jgi:hypothetical protein